MLIFAISVCFLLFVQWLTLLCWNILVIAHLVLVQDDILPKLMTYNGSHEDLFRKEIAKYDHICEEIAQNIKAQEQLLIQIEVCMKSPPWKDVYQCTWVFLETLSFSMHPRVFFSELSLMIVWGSLEIMLYRSFNHIEIASLIFVVDELKNLDIEFNTKQRSLFSRSLFLLRAPLFFPFFFFFLNFFFNIITQFLLWYSELNI